MAVPALRAVRGRFPEAEIAAHQLIAYDSHAKHSGIFGRERLVAELRTMRFDVALLLQNAFDAAWLAWRAGIPERIGYARDGRDRKSTRLNSSHGSISYAVFCLKKKK